jgi:hypothetical protein
MEGQKIEDSILMRNKRREKVNGGIENFDSIYLHNEEDKGEHPWEIYWIFESSMVVVSRYLLATMK